MAKKWGAIVLAALLAAGLAFLAGTGELAAIPFKVWLLAGGLAAAAIATRLRQFWMRHVLLIASIAYFGFFEGSCLCTNGALQNIFLFSALGRWAGVIEAAIQVVLVFLVIYLFGNLFCGWICHKGAVQEFLFRQQLHVKVPEPIDRWLQKIKYVLLAMIILWPLLLREKLFLKIDPFKALFNLEGTTFLLLFGGVVLLSSLFLFRPFCRYVCPFGAAAGIVNRLGLFRLKMKPGRNCTGCNACLSRCPAAAVRPRRGQEAVCDPVNCLACGECILACRMME